MEQNYNPYIRLQAYLTYLANEGDIDAEVENGYTIALLSDKIAVPVEVVRSDIANILEYGIGKDYDAGLDINIDYDCEAYVKLDKKYGLGDDSVAWNEMDNQVRRIVELIRSGEFDDVILTYTAKDNDRYILQLTPEEYRAISSLGNSGREQYLLPFLVKDSFRFKSNRGKDKLFRNICYAFRHKKCLRIRYRSQKGKEHDENILPIKIVYDSIDNEYALVTVHSHEVKAYRLNRLLEAAEIDDKIEISEKDMHLLDNIDQVWGMEFMDKPRQVKVRFYNAGNVWDKVRRDLSYRTKGRLYEKDNYLYYEDTVYGLYSFRSWVFGYGAAAIVEEPKELRESIIKSLLERQAENNSK